MSFAEISDWIFENIQTLFFPEELVSLDMKLSKVELIALLFIDRKGEVIMSGLAEYLNVSMSTATGIADRLSRQHLLERQRSEADRRIVTLSLSPEGRKISTSVASLVDGYLDLASGALSSEEQEQLIHLISKILAAFRRAAEGSADRKKPELERLRRISID